MPKRKVAFFLVQYQKLVRKVHKEPQRISKCFVKLGATLSPLWNNYI